VLKILEEPIFWYCLIVLLFGFSVLFAIYRFGQWLGAAQVINFREFWPPGFYADLIKLFQDQKVRWNIPLHLVNANAEYLQRRNEFWTTYVQVLVAALIIIVLAILMLTKTIGPDAGLPILSAVSGFAIAKSVSSGRTGNDRDNQQQ
jgi:Mn2+/Fe2+ NRAMP family transporter